MVVIPRCIVPQADRCLRCLVPACGSATELCTLSGIACGVPSKLSDRLRNVGSTSRDRDALVGAWNGIDFFFFQKGTYLFGKKKLFYFYFFLKKIFEV